MVDTIETSHTEQPNEQPEKVAAKTEPTTEAHLEAGAAGQPSVEIDQGEDPGSMLVTPSKELVPTSPVSATPGPVAVRHAERMAQSGGSDDESGTSGKDPRFFSRREERLKKEAQDAAEPETQTSGSGSGQPPTGEKPTPSEEDGGDDDGKDGLSYEDIQKALEAKMRGHPMPEPHVTFHRPGKNPWEPRQEVTIPLEKGESFKDALAKAPAWARGEEEEPQSEPEGEESTTGTIGSDKTGEVEKVLKGEPKTNEDLKKLLIIEEAPGLIQQTDTDDDSAARLSRLQSTMQQMRDESRSPAPPTGKEVGSPAEKTEGKDVVGMTGSGKTGAVEEALKGEESTAPRFSVFETGKKDERNDLAPKDPNAIFATEPTKPGLTDPDAIKDDKVQTTLARMTEAWEKAYATSEFPDPLATILKSGLQKLYDEATHTPESPLTLDRLRELIGAEVQQAYGNSETAMGIGGILEGRLADGSFMAGYAPEQSVAGIPEAGIISDLITTGPLATGETMYSRAEETTQKLLEVFERSGTPISPIFIPVMRAAALRLQTEAVGPLRRDATFGRLTVLIQQELRGAGFGMETEKALGDAFENGRQKLERAAAKASELNLPDHVDPRIENTFVAKDMGAFTSIKQGPVDAPPAVIARAASNRVEPGILKLPAGYDENSLMQIRGLTSLLGEVTVTAGQAKNLARIGVQLIELDNRGEVQPPLSETERESIAHLLRSVGRRAL
jgi:hypothetical protein